MAASKEKSFTMQPIQLSIPTPCHEKWENMQPVEQGRFCNACAKEVVDFSTMSDAQVLNYFSILKSESICGRAYSGQLNRVMEPIAIPKKKKWYWNYIALFLVFFAKSGESKAQKGKMAIQQPVQHPTNIREVGEIAIAEPSRAISGKVLNNSGSPIPFATITIPGTTRRYTSGKDGGFVFLVTEKEQKLMIAATGFKTQTIALNSNTNYTIKLEQANEVPERVVTAGMMIVRPAPPKKKKN